MANTYRQPSLTVTHNGAPLTGVLSANVRGALSSRVASAVVDVTTRPANLQPWDEIVITMGATTATAAVRFTGYFITAENTLWPKGTVLNCRGKLALAEVFEATENYDLSDAGTGATDEVMISTVLYHCRSAGAWTPADVPLAMTNIGGTGETLGTVAKDRAFQWREGESGTALIDRLDAVCLGYRTYDSFDGTIKRTQVSSVPVGTASATFTEHVDIAAAAETKTILEARNKVIVSGYPGANGNAAISYTAIGANPFLVTAAGQWYLTNKTSSAMIEKQATADAGAGLSCEEVANWLLGELNRYREQVELTTPRDDVIEPGAIIAVQAPTRLGLTSRLFWVESVSCSISRSGVFQQVLSCLTGVPLSESSNGAVLSALSTASAWVLSAVATGGAQVSAAPSSAVAFGRTPAVTGGAQIGVLSCSMAAWVLIPANITLSVFAVPAAAVARGGSVTLSGYEHVNIGSPALAASAYAVMPLGVTEADVLTLETAKSFFWQENAAFLLLE